MSYIDRDGDRAVYKQVADHLRGQIMSGELAGGSELSSEDDLAATYNVSKTTIRQAVDILRREALIDSGRGRKSRIMPVRRLGTRRYEAARMGYDYRRVDQEHGIPWEEFKVTREYLHLPAPERVARLLNIPAGEQVCERLYTHASEDAMYRMSKSYLQVSRFQGTVLLDENEPVWPGGTIAQLDSLGIRVDAVREEVQTRRPTEDEADALKISRDQPVLVVWRTMLTAEGDPVEAAMHVYPGDRHILVYDLPVRATEHVHEVDTNSGRCRHCGGWMPPD